MSAYTGDAELRTMLAGLERDARLSGGGPAASATASGDGASSAVGGADGTDKATAKILRELSALIEPNNKLKELQAQGAQQRIVLKGPCPTGMDAVDIRDLESKVAAGNMQRPPFTQVVVKDAETGELMMCVPDGISVENSSNASNASAAVIGAAIAKMLAEKPQGGVTIDLSSCMARGPSVRTCAELGDECQWYSNGCYSGEEVNKQLHSEYGKLEEALKSTIEGSAAHQKAQAAMDALDVKARKILQRFPQYQPQPQPDDGGATEHDEGDEGDEAVER